ncbi:MAG: helix-turn-helix domain-containing protein [Tumebacillaceae bacterium]
MIGQEVEERNRIIGQNLRKYRLLKGMTQDELAEGICSVSQLSKAENGKTYVKRSILKELAERLGITVEKVESVDPLQEELREKLRVAQDAIAIGQYDYAYKLVTEVKEQSETFGYSELWTYAVHNECVLLSKQNKHKETIEIIEQAMKNALFAEYYKTRLLLRLGLSYEQIGSMSAAADCYRRAEQEFEETEEESDNKTSLSVYFNLTKCNVALKNYHNALRYAEKCLELAQVCQQHLYTLRVKYMMAFVLAKLGRDEQAKNLYMSTLTEAENNSFMSDVAIISNNFGEFLIEQGEYARAKMLLRRSKTTFELLGEGFYICETYLHLSDLELLEGNVDAAIEYLNLVFTTVEKQGVSSFKEKARALVKLGKIRKLQGDFEDFVKLVTEGITIFEENDVLDEAFAVAVDLAEGLDKMDDPRAIRYYRKAIESQKKRIV